MLLVELQNQIPMTKLTPKDRKNMTAILQQIAKHKPKHLKSPPHKPKKELLQQRYCYNPKTKQVDILADEMILAFWVTKYINSELYT